LRLISLNARQQFFFQPSPTLLEPLNFRLVTSFRLVTLKEIDDVAVLVAKARRSFRPSPLTGARSLHSRRTLPATAGCTPRLRLFPSLLRVLSDAFRGQVSKTSDQDFIFRISSTISGLASVEMSPASSTGPHCTSFALIFVFVGFSNDRRLALVVRFGVVVFVIIIVIVGVSRRDRVAHDGDESPLGRGKVLTDALGHGRLLAGRSDARY
jgi:hypothetical protein